MAMATELTEHPDPFRVTQHEAPTSTQGGEAPGPHLSPWHEFGLQMCCEYIHMDKKHMSLPRADRILKDAMPTLEGCPCWVPLPSLVPLPEVQTLTGPALCRAQFQSLSGQSLWPGCVPRAQCLPDAAGSDSPAPVGPHPSF